MATLDHDNDLVIELEKIEILCKDNLQTHANLHSEKQLLEIETDGIDKSKTSRVIIYCLFKRNFSKLINYDVNEISNLLLKYQKDNFFIIQIDNDIALYEKILKHKFKSDYENIYKMFDLKLDYCFSPIDELLCFNLSVLTNIDAEQVQKHLIQIFFSKNGLYIINKDCCENILDIFKYKFQFQEVHIGEFFEEALLKNQNQEVLINDINIFTQLKNDFRHENLIKNKRRKSSINNPLVSTGFTASKIRLEHKKIIAGGTNTVTNFSTDDLIYYLLTFSLDKLEEYSNYLMKEVGSLKGIYLELSQNERKDFFRRLHNMEISLQLIFQETVIKKKFLKYSKAQFRVYNNLSNDFYFKNTFNFFIELMISRVTDLEMNLEQLKNTITMIKENYSIIIEDNTEKQNIKLNNIMKVLAMITTVYTPFNIIPNLFGMNVKVPFRDVDNLWPFFGVIMFCVCILLLELWIFRKLKWF